ncbi:MAG: exo-alpha-sialidase [Anaerolineales bacterium]|nr:exo-alpha-sialidase [Anaerolineales bacterium]
MKTFQVRLVVSIICVILITGLGYVPVNAGKPTGWSPDEKVPGYLDDTFTPFLLADHNKTIQAFASQWVENQGRRRAIVYRQWTLVGGWTRPVDIILSPTRGDANFLWAFMDSLDNIHLIFSATQSSKTAVYYTSAPAINADRASAWSTPMLIGENALLLNSAVIIGDGQENLVIIYSGNRDGSGVYYMQSKDTGKTWTSPLPVFLTYDSSLSAFSLRLVLGTEQKIRATWNVVTNLGEDESLYFANFDLQKSEWDTPIELDQRINIRDYFGPSFPAIVDNGREIIVVYNSGNPFKGRPVDLGRPVQFFSLSKNGGVTWSDPSVPFPFHVGRSGEHTLLLDGDGVPHTLFIQRIDTKDESGKYSSIGGVWHSKFQNGIWTNPDRFVTTYAPHDIRAAISQGNVLLAVWREDPGVERQHGIWYSYNVLDASQLPASPLATAEIDYSVKVESTTASSPLTFNETPTPSSQADLFNESPPSPLGNNPALPVIIGIIPVLLILIGVLVGYRFVLNRNK